jgi:membrane protein YqaA with SNARE-associated domain
MMEPWTGTCVGYYIGVFLPPMVPFIIWMIGRKKNRRGWIHTGRIVTFVFLAISIMTVFKHPLP